MKSLSYKIHLPAGTVITAKNEQELKNILSMNVCRVYQSCQIRIEPVWEARPANTAIRKKLNNFVSSLRRHELDCQCADCQTL